MNLLISLHSDIPIYEQIKKQVKKLIFQKKMSVDEQMPSIRMLAKELQVGIITVKRAYDDLVSEGYLYSKSAKGYYVSTYNDDSIKIEYLNRIKAHLKQIESLKEEAHITNQDIEIFMNHKGRN